MLALLGSMLTMQEHPGCMLARNRDDSRRAPCIHKLDINRVTKVERSSPVWCADGRGLRQSWTQVIVAAPMIDGTVALHK